MKLFSKGNELSFIYDHDLTSSIHFGLLGKIKLRDKMNFHPEGQYIQKRSHYYVGALNIVKRNYVGLPIAGFYQGLEWVELMLAG